MATRITSIVPLLFITLICVGIVEGGYQAFEYFILKPPVAENTLTGKAAEAEATQKAELPKKHDYRIILQRNLFGPPPGKSETKASDTTDNTEELQSTSLNIVLMGTVNGSEGTNRAIILDKKSRDQELYETGDAIQGAFVKEILRGKVILALKDKNEILDMSEAAEMRPTYKAPGAIQKSGRKAYTPVRRSGRRVAPTAQEDFDPELFDPEVSPRGTPRRVNKRPRVIRPSRQIRVE